MKFSTVVATATALTGATALPFGLFRRQNIDKRQGGFWETLASSAVDSTVSTTANWASQQGAAKMSEHECEDGHQDADSAVCSSKVVWGDGEDEDDGDDDDDLDKRDDSDDDDSDDDDDIDDESDIDESDIDGESDVPDDADGDGECDHPEPGGHCDGINC